MLKKITVGFVIQDYDKATGKCVSQEFVARDQIFWKNENGKSIAEGITCDFSSFPFHMVQPDNGKSKKSSSKACNKRIKV